MPITTTFDKTRKDLERTLADIDPTPLYAVVGAGDLAVEKIRAARAELSSRAESVQSEVLGAPAQAKALPTKAQSAVGEAIATALTTYSELASRGKKLVTRVGGQQATQDLRAQAKSTGSSAKATTTTAKKQAAATRKSAATTASTAKKSTGRAKTPAKATATSAKKTASAAKRAAATGASKVGD